MDLRRRPLLAGAAALFLAGIANRLIGTVYRVLLVRAAGEDVVGLFQMTMPVYRIVATIATAGIPVAIARLARLATEFGGKYEPIFGRGACATTARAPGFAAHLCEVEVDRSTGEVRIVRHVVVQDVGRALNPVGCEGQIEGGIHMGLGYCLTEELRLRDGQVLNPGFLDYKLLTAPDMPEILITLIETVDEAGPFGAKGLGEAGTIPISAAVANAVKDATGVRMTELPMTPERVYRALQRSKE